MAGTNPEQVEADNNVVIRPIVGLTAMLPKEALEVIVVEAILCHRFLRDVAELRLSETRGEVPRIEAVGSARLAYIRAMIECHAQQACLSTLLEVLGYVPDMPAEQE